MVGIGWWCLVIWPIIIWVGLDVLFGLGGQRAGIGELPWTLLLCTGKPSGAETETGSNTQDLVYSSRLWQLYIYYM